MNHGGAEISLTDLPWLSGAGCALCFCSPWASALLRLVLSREDRGRARVLVSRPRRCLYTGEPPGKAVRFFNGLRLATGRLEAL